MHKIFKTAKVALVLICILPYTIQASVSTSLFTGRLTYSIPLYTIDDPDFHLNITLKYSSEGFKPFQPSGCYGQDWALVAGGCITRSVQAIADEQKVHYTDGILRSDQQVGMLQSIKDGDNPTKESVFDFSTPLYKSSCGIQYYQDDYIYYDSTSTGSYCDWNRDYMPDIFYFSFHGHSGRFIINNTGQPVILSGDFVQIDVSNLKVICENSSQNSFYVPEDSSSITIRTTDGYTYIFGGSRNAMEYSTSVTKDDQLDQCVPAITAWHLTKIIAPNGRTLTFSYVNTSAHIWSSTNLHSFCVDYDWCEQEDSESHLTYSLHKDCLLQSIRTSDSIPLVINFLSHLESHRMFDHPDVHNCVPHLQLDSIIVSYNGDTLKTANLTYRYCSYNAMEQTPDYDYNWRYLHQVRISGVGVYSMNYNIIDPYADPEAYSLHGSVMMSDHWFPKLYPITDIAYKNMVDRFGFWKVSALQGLLKEVVLPTGGKQCFSYGVHQYGEERRYQVVGEHDVELFTRPVMNDTIGGARIEKIETFSDENTLVETQNFAYQKNGTNTSSGIFYNNYWVFYPSNPNAGVPITNPYNYSTNYSHIGYSYAEKETTIGSDTYKTGYTFDTGSNTYNSATNNYINRRTNVPDYSDSAEVCSGSLTHTENLKLTGKLLAIEDYIGNNLAKSTLFSYNGITNNMEGMTPNIEQSLGCTDTIVILSKYSGHVARKLFVYPDVMEKYVCYEYEGGNTPIITDRTYTYDRKLRTKKITTYDSRGIPQFTKYNYPDDLPNVYPPSPLFFLITSNRIGEPVETTSGYETDGVEYITDGRINIYENNTYTNGSNLYFRPYLSQTLSLSLLNPVSSYQPMSSTISGINYDSLYVLDTEYSFDIMGRLLSAKPFGKIETRYTWDGLYPASKTIGNQTYTYTYKPYVGVSSVTDPRGVTTYYSYDKAGRLIEEYQIVNGNKQILKAYQYHNKTE